MCGHIPTECHYWPLTSDTDFLWSLSPVSHEWRKNEGKDLELWALLRKVDVSEGAGADSESQAPAKKEEGGQAKSHMGSEGDSPSRWQSGK